jgi:hypothetical protein
MGNVPLPDRLEVPNVLGRTVWLRLVTGQVTATATPGKPPLPLHWVVEVPEGRQHTDPIKWGPGDIDAVAVRDRVERWAAAHPAAFR